MNRRRFNIPPNRADLITLWIARLAILAVFIIAAAGLWSAVAH